MTPEKDSELCAKYPKIFCDRGGSPQETLMCYGFECGDGWFDIIDTLCKQIQHHVDWQVKQQDYKAQRGEIQSEDVQSEDCFQVVAVQVKEKFGSMRFYVDGGDDEVRGMIKMAEAMSCKTCEDCGARGEKRNMSWVRTLCGSCHEAHKNRTFR